MNECKLCKGGVLTYFERMKSEQQRLDKEIKSVSSKLKHLPEGKLICSRNGNRYKWYHRSESGKIYIPKENRGLAEMLALKRYLMCQQNYLEQKKKAVERYLELYPKVNEAEQLLLEKPEFQSLLTPHIMPLSKELSDWAEASYEKNPKYPEQLTQKAGGGILVRSKSEAMIAMALRLNKIPFRYECLLKLGNYQIYPDFTIRHPSTGEIYYWEHFGMMDDSSYSHKACLKLKEYILHGIIPSIQLITTYETRDKPLNMEMIEHVIDYHFK